MHPTTRTFTHSTTNPTIHPFVTPSIQPLHLLLHLSFVSSFKQTETSHRQSVLSEKFQPMHFVTQLNSADYITGLQTLACISKVLQLSSRHKATRNEKLNKLWCLLPKARATLFIIPLIVRPHRNLRSGSNTSPRPLPGKRFSGVSRIM
jgi:hypothetical protein